MLGRGAVDAERRVELRLDEALAFGEEVRARVVEVRVALGIEVEAVLQHVRDPQRERADGDDRQGRTEPARVRRLIGLGHQAGVGGPMNTAIGMLRSSICVISCLVAVGTPGAIASMNRLLSTCGHEARLAIGAKIGDHLRVQLVELRPFRVGAGIGVRHLLEAGVALPVDDVGTGGEVDFERRRAVVDDVVARRAGTERLARAHVEPAPVELVQQAESGRSDRLARRAAT